MRVILWRRARDGQEKTGVLSGWCRGPWLRL